VSQWEAAGFEDGDCESYWLVKCESTSMGIVMLTLKIETALCFEASVSFYQTTIHKIRHNRCVYNKLDLSLYTCLTQLYGGIDMYNLLHKEQLNVSTLFIGHLQTLN